MVSIRGMRTHGIGIIGAGSIAGAHLRAAAALQSTELRAIADTHEERLARACAEHGCRGYSTYHDLLADDQVDVAIVCLPHAMHCEAAVAALEAGKHVLVEKPMAVDVEQCDTMIEAARRSGRQLTVGHMHHFSPQNRAVKKLLDERALGDLVCLCDEAYRPFNPARPAWYLDKATHGGLWYQNGIHLIDRSCWWTGSRVAAVKALIDSRFFEFSADDVAMALLHFQNGVHATLIHVWWRTGGTRFSTEFVCTDGMIQLRRGIHSGREDVFVGKEGNWEQVTVAEDHDTTSLQLQAFVDAIDAGTEPPVTAEYARHLVEVMTACLESSRSGREVVLA